MNSLLQVFHLVGALGLFIYGMVLMSESIQRLTGNRLRSAVSAVTRNPARAYFSGLSLTGILQSSSVTSLMVVSFVQVGLLRLSEAQDRTTLGLRSWVRRLLSVLRLQHFS